ncbi:MAG: hypothetical protein WC627_11610 [Legionella sp.]|jgi:hypothetical protein
MFQSTYKLREHDKKAILKLRKELIVQLNNPLHVLNIITNTKSDKDKAIMTRALNDELDACSQITNGKRYPLEFATCVLTEIDLGPSQDPNHRNKIHLVKLIEEYLKYGANPNLFYGNPNKQGQQKGTPLQILLKYSKPVNFEEKQKYAFKDLAIKLINAGADISVKDEEGNSIAHLAAALDAELLQFILEKAPQQANEHNRRNETPIFAALHKHNGAAANLLLTDTYKISINTLNLDNLTPLFLAIQMIEPGIVAKLLGLNANVVTPLRTITLDKSASNPLKLQLMMNILARSGFLLTLPFTKGLFEASKTVQTNLEPDQRLLVIDNKSAPESETFLKHLQRIHLSYQQILKACEEDERLKSHQQSYYLEHQAFLTKYPSANQGLVKEIIATPPMASSSLSTQNHLDDIAFGFREALTTRNDQFFSTLLNTIKTSLNLIKDQALSKKEIESNILSIAESTLIFNTLLNSGKLTKSLEKFLASSLYPYTVLMVNKYLQLKAKAEDYNAFNDHLLFIISVTLTLVKTYKLHRIDIVLDFLEHLIHQFEALGISTKIIITYKALYDEILILALLRKQNFDQIALVLEDINDYALELEELFNFNKINPNKDQKLFLYLNVIYSKVLSYMSKIDEFNIKTYTTIVRCINQQADKLELYEAKIKSTEKQMEIQKYYRNVFEDLNMTQSSIDGKNLPFSIKLSEQILELIPAPNIDKDLFKRHFHRHPHIKSRNEVIAIHYLGKTYTELSETSKFLKALTAAQFTINQKQKSQTVEVTLSNDKINPIEKIQVKEPQTTTAISTSDDSDKSFDEQLQASPKIAKQKNKASASSSKFFKSVDARKESNEAIAKSNEYKKLIEDVKKEIADAKNIPLEDIALMQIPGIPANRAHTHFSIWTKITGVPVEKDILARHKEIAQNGTYAQQALGANGFKYDKDFEKSYTKICGNSIAAGYRVDQTETEIFNSTAAKEPIKLATFGSVRAK